MRTTAWFKALADDTRLRTFRVLAEAKQGLCVAELVDVLQKPTYAVSRAAIELRKAGLVAEERHGKFVYYTLAELVEVARLGEWTREHCRCDAVSLRNPDGSRQPGGSPCDYDSERLRWRLALRQPSKAPLTHLEHEADARVRVLFVCVHNSARSQLAVAYLRQFAGDRVWAQSAGLVAGTLNPHVVAVLAEEGIDIAEKSTQAVADLFRRGETYDWVITVCSREAEEGCPVFPGPVRRLSWPFPDPSAFTGTEAEVRTQVRALAQEIRAQVQTFVENLPTKENP